MGLRTVPLSPLYVVNSDILGMPRQPTLSRGPGVAKVRKTDSPYVVDTAGSQGRRTQPG